MGRTFDLLEQLQGQLAKRPGGARFQVAGAEPDTGSEEEVNSAGTGNDEYPSLDRARLRQGYRLCLGDAKRLISDSAVLKESGRLRSAYATLLLAVEELKCAARLYEAGHPDVGNREERWNSYLNRPNEQGSSRESGESKADERSGRDRRELLYVYFDSENQTFVSPPGDQDSNLLILFERETAYAEDILKTLPSCAFERREFQELAQQSPEDATPVLYSRIEDIVSQEPATDEKELLTAAASDLGMPLEEFAAGFERWRKVSPKARAYMALLQRVRENLKKAYIA